MEVAQEVENLYRQQELMLLILDPVAGPSMVLHAALRTVQMSVHQNLHECNGV